MNLKSVTSFFESRSDHKVRVGTELIGRRPTFKAGRLTLGKLGPGKTGPGEWQKWSAVEEAIKVLYPNFTDTTSGKP